MQQIHRLLLHGNEAFFQTLEFLWKTRTQLNTRHIFFDTFGIWEILIRGTELNFAVLIPRPSHGPSRGPSAPTKTLKAKQTDQCDSIKGMPQGGFDLFLCDVTMPTHLHQALISSACSTLRFSSLSRKVGVKNANLFHTAVTSHHDIKPTLLQGPSLWKCQTCSFHLREILSDLLSPIFLGWGACLYKAMFHLNIKECEEVARRFKWHFLGFFWGMWLLKCPRLTNLITASIQSLWWQPNNNLYLPILCSAERVDTDLHHSMLALGSAALMAL